MNIDGLWKGILSLKQYLRHTDDLPEILYLSIEKNEVTVELPRSAPDTIIILSSLNRNGHFYVNDQHDIERGEMQLSSEVERFLSLYLPICFYQMKAKKRKSAFTIAHFAQSLDAKIATENGASQWIGNEENLIHAHRMRALCDGVLIGANTLKTDKPRLTVRHVEGTDPVRIVMGDGDYDFSSLSATETDIYQVHANGNSGTENVNLMRVGLTDGCLDCHDVLKKLFSEEIYTIYIEGGSFTSSSFLEQGALDIVQLHIAPIIVGSGISSFTLPVKDDLGQSVNFKNPGFVNMGTDIMFIGEIKYE